MTLTPAQALRLAAFHDAYTDAMSRCPPEFKIASRDYRIALSACHVGPLTRSLEDLGLVTLQGYGDPPHTYFVSVTDAGEAALKELDSAQ